MTSTAPAINKATQLRKTIPQGDENEEGAALEFDELPIIGSSLVKLEKCT